MQRESGRDRVVPATEEMRAYQRLLPYAVVLGAEDAWVAATESSGGANEWLPDEVLGQVLGALTDGDLVARVERRLAPFAGGITASRMATSTTGYTSPTSHGGFFGGAPSG